MTAFADPALLLADMTREVWTPRADLPLDVWCDTHRVLASEGTGAARAGAWDTDNTPYLREPLRRLQDPEVKELAYWKSAQIGYTDGILVNWLLYLIAEKRQAALVVYPTADKGTAVNRRRILPAVRACGPTARMITRAHDLTQNELRIGNVPIFFGYSKSADALRGDPIGPVAADEIDAFDNTGNDTLGQCRSRQTTFPDRMLVKGSTPEDDQGIIAEYNHADVRWRFMVPCPFTGCFFELWEFGQLGWFGGLETTPEAAAATCYIRSPFAQPGETLRIREHLRPWMVRNGIWVSQDETVESDGAILGFLDRETGGYQEDGDHTGDGEHRRDACATKPGHIGRLTSDFFRSAAQEPDRRLRDQGMSPGPADALRDRLGIRIVGTRNRGPNHAFRSNSLTSLIDADGPRGTVAAFVRAKGHPDPTWWKERLGQPPSAKAERVEITRLRELCIPAPPGHRHGEVPDWAIISFTIVDVQKTCIKLGVLAFGPEARQQALCFTRVVPRDPERLLEEPAILDALANLELARVRSALRVRPKATFIDSAHYTEEVYQLVRRLRRAQMPAWPVKGTDRDGNGRSVWRATVTEKNLPDGRRESRPDPVELIHFADDYLSTLFVSRAMARADTMTGELADVEDLDIDDLTPVRVALPDLNGWEDGEAVLDEIANAQRIAIGAGSGLSGKDGRGRSRRVWRKRHAHRPNDYFDICKMGHIAERVYQIDRATREAVTAMTARAPAERRVRGGMEM